MDRITNRRTLAVLLAPVILLALVVSLAQAQSGPAPVTDRAGFRRPTTEILELAGDIRGDVETRRSLGLRADVEYVAALRESPENVGTARFGFPLTTAEAAEVEARFAFAAAAHETVLPFVENLPSFAGAYFDHQKGGELVILLTTVDKGEQAEILSLAPDGRATRVELVEHTQAQLREALSRAWQVWRAAGSVEAYAIAVDTPANAIRIDVDAASLEAAQELAFEVGSVLDLPVFVSVGERPQESACTDREHCTSPMRGGIVIRKGSTSGVRCTMGFHIQVGSDEKFVTAGHCGHTGSNSWYHSGYGFVGSEQTTQYYHNGRDIMVVQIPDSQDSSILYSSSVAVDTTWDPYVGEGLCASLGVSSSAWKCGSVQDDYLSWFATKCQCTIFGGDSSITSVEGDSGSPMVDASYRYLAVGIMNTASGHFAIVDSALAAWGYDLRQ